MKKTFLFTTIAIGLIGLLGFSYVPKEKQAKQESHITTTINKKDRKVNTSDSEPLDSNATYYLVAKNYGQNGEGVFYQNSISLSNSAIVTSTHRSYGVGEFDLIVDGNISRTGLQFTSELDSGVYKLDAVFLYNATTHSNLLRIYFASQGLFQRSYCAILCKNILYTAGDFYWYLNEFFDIYLLDGGSFSFNSQINYYAPYGQDIDTDFVNDSNMTSSSSYSFKTILEGQPFYSGGLVFDTIRLRYDSAQALSYYDNSGARQTWTASQFAGYSWIEYVNSVSNRIIVVNQRLTQAWNSGNSSGVVQSKGSRWVSTEYQKIQFFNEPNQTIITTLSTLNNSSYQANTYVIANNDVGLGGAFTLLSQAFSSWIPILSVSIVPGITLGMLIFLPLIAGIIILIIWIVKR